MTIFIPFILAFIGSVLFFATLIAVHFVRHDLPFTKHAFSKYGLGKSGWLLSLGLYSIGSAQIFLAYGLFYLHGWSVGNSLLTCAGIGSVIVAFFKMELPRKTWRGQIHVLGAGMQFLFFPIALLFLSVLFLDSLLFVTTLFIAISDLLLLCFITYFFIKNTTHQTKYYGLIQKMNIILMASWVALVSFLFVSGYL